MSNPSSASSALFIAEMQEFASFTAREQWFIELGLEIASDPQQYDGIFLKWSRNLSETRAIFSRQQAYAGIETIKGLIPNGFNAGAIKSLMGPLIDLSNYDLMDDYIESFSAYRFLYERLFGVRLRPWLPSAFCAAAAMPNLPPDKRRMLLQSLSEAAATSPGWSERKTAFFPKWIDKQI